MTSLASWGTLMSPPLVATSQSEGERPQIVSRKTFSILGTGVRHDAGD